MILLHVVWLVSPLHAQTIDDGIMMGKRSLFAGYVYTHDSWNLYWEGALKRDNENIGTITTQSNLLFGNYGVTDRLNVIAAAPYVWTRASQGVLSGMEGVQDITLAAKYSLIEKPSMKLGSVRHCRCLRLTSADGLHAGFPRGCLVSPSTS